MCNWVHDLLDKKADVKDELWRMEQDLRSKREKLAQFKARKRELEGSGLNTAGLVVSSSVSGLSKDSTAETRAPKKKKKGKKKPKRHPDLS